MNLSTMECLTTSKKIIDLSSMDILISQKKVFWTFCSSKIEGFKIDDANKEVLNGLFLYFHGNTGIFDLNKGIYMFGNFGCGKTSIMTLFSKYLSCYFPFSEFGFSNYSTEEVIESYKDEKDIKQFIFSSYSEKPFQTCFHEIGKELNEKHYGTDMDQVINRLMMRRYEIFQKYGTRTHCTSNFSPNQLQTFDTAVLDRFKEMFNFVEWKGESLR